MAQTPQCHTPRRLFQLPLNDTDGHNYYFKFDVTESILNAPDPLDIHLRLGPITIPLLSGSGSGDGGLDVGVDDWDFIIIDMES